MSIAHFTSDSFDKEVLHAKGIVMVDFWAPWCGPCKMLGPIIEDFANGVGDKAVVGKVNIDEEQDLAMKFGIMSIPTILVFKDGKEVNRAVGLQSKQNLIQMIENA